MAPVAWALVFTTLTPLVSPFFREAKLAALVVEVRSADYRGDRAALARLEANLGELDDAALADYRDYGRGFARWRRALNGFNETPTPTDLTSDLESAVAHFRASLERRPDWIEAKLALVGCWGNLAYLAGSDMEKKKPLLAELIPVYKWLEANGHNNPRALWIIGGMQFAAPPPYGGDVVKATATLRRGVELAWRESAAGAASPAWVPALPRACSPENERHAAAGPPISLRTWRSQLRCSSLMTSKRTPAAKRWSSPGRAQATRAFTHSGGVSVSTSSRTRNKPTVISSPSSSIPAMPSHSLSRAPSPRALKTCSSRSTCFTVSR